MTTPTAQEQALEMARKCACFIREDKNPRLADTILEQIPLAELIEVAQACQRLSSYGDVFRYKECESNPYEQASNALAALRQRGVSL